MLQDDPLAEEFSGFVPAKTYSTRAEAEQGEHNWDEVWEFPLPWIGQFMLSPFRLDPQMPLAGGDDVEPRTGSVQTWT